jgi:hypothetical protein
MCKIDEDEYEELAEYIHMNIPQTLDGAYSWEPYKKEPRLKWLNEQISRL